MTKKHKLSHAEREKAAMLRNELKRAERVTAAQARKATEHSLRQAVIDQERADREAAIATLPPKAQEMVRQQQTAMTTSRARFNALLAMAAVAAMAVPVGRQ